MTRTRRHRRRDQVCAALLVGAISQCHALAFVWHGSCSLRGMVALAQGMQPSARPSAPTCSLGAARYPSMEETIGNTPLVQVSRIVQDSNGNTLLLKLEGNNPAGSVKDRPALNMIRAAEGRGALKPGDTLIEATSGNTGIALAMAAAVRGYKIVLIMPDNMSEERRATMRVYGAQIISVSGGMLEARDLAMQMQADGKGIVLDQFANADNPEAHYLTTGPEIWEQTRGAVTHFVSSMGTTGTIMGVSRYLKETDPDVQIVGVHPAEGGKAQKAALQEVCLCCPRSLILARMRVRRRADSGHSKVASGISPRHLRRGGPGQNLGGVTTRG